MDWDAPSIPVRSKGCKISSWHPWSPQHIMILVATSQHPAIVLVTDRSDVDSFECSLLFGEEYLC